MACNSELKDGSDLNIVKIPEACSNEGLSVNPDLYVNYGCGDTSMDDDGLRALFDQVLSFFLKEVSVNKNAFRPFPPKLGDGVEADLFKLFLTVRRIGSYELVSENNMWEFVANECGFEIELMASVKLVYVKYLKELDQWLNNGGFKDEEIENVETGVIQKLDLLSHQLDGCRFSESNQIGKSLSDDEIVGFEDGKKGKCVGIESDYNEGTLGNKKNEGTSEGMNLEVAKTSMPLSRINFDNEQFRVGGYKRCELSSENAVKNVELPMINDVDDDKEFSVEDDKQIESSIKMVVSDIIRFHSDNDVALIAKDDEVNNVEKAIGSVKRKRKDKSLLLSEMVDWVANAGRNPHGFAFATSQKSSKWKNYTCDKLRMQALLSRQALFAQLNFDSGNEAKGSQKKNQRMHPAMYEDDRVASERNNCCKKDTSCTCGSCNLRSSSRMKRQRTESGKIIMARINETTKSQDQKYNLGSRYQAQVPEWTGVVSESDPKWLGTRMWPPPDNQIEIHQKGSLVINLRRQRSCECMFPGSAECVRFHIAESRFKLKLELGDLFFRWKFHQMGEEVSLPWELEEEKRFKSLVVKARQELLHSNKSRHEIMNRFWKKASEIIPAKPKPKIVSYYFNVFVLRRRSYQNRVTPKDIDSDNDEEEVGSVGDRFGYEKIHGVLLTCSENMQCRDLDS